MSQATLSKPSRRDYRLPLAVFVVSATLLLGYFFDRVTEQDAAESPVAPAPRKPALATHGFDQLQPAAPASADGPGRELGPALAGTAQPPSQKETVAGLLKKGRQEVDQKRFDQALVTLAQAIQLQPVFPEAYTAGGYALLGKKLPDNARTAFMRAINMNPGLADAYFGLGFALDALGEPEAALSAMRSYLHLTPVKDPYNKTVITARSAIWEIESGLGRGPWGPSRGIPPGLTEAEVRRDGKGVGMMTPLPDGTSRAQVRPSDHTSAR